MGRNFWPVFVAVSTLSAAIVWRFSPDVGQKLPYAFRDFLHDTFYGRTPASARPSAGKSPAAAVVAEAVPAPAAAPEAAAASVPVQGGRPATEAPRSAKSAKEPAPVAKTAENPTGSPYLEAAAKALREYRQLSADFEKRQKQLDLAQQRATMKKLHALNQRVEFLNRKHREWKNAHPAGK